MKTISNSNVQCWSSCQRISIKQVTSSPTYNFKNNRTCLILQDVVPRCAPVGNITLIGGYFWNQELEHKKKQQNGRSALLGMVPHFPLHSCQEERLDKLINLSFSHLSASTAQISPPSKVSSDLGSITNQKKPSHLQEEAPWLPRHKAGDMETHPPGAWTLLLIRVDV